ncbi:hypothetical protein [Mycobacterium sp. 1081908.1]|uniref:hypothetical protein n=1 Tax=Mycobacterium sp. 1081908.1 TaxID=1834066 RepID=UPI0012EA3759|nr:hypothetical protein [Mycobacterium sp. 1081908.1]
MTDASGSLEVWLRQDDEEIVCTVVRDDESTYELDVDALSMRGAQREMTGYFIDEGYEPAGPWQDEVAGHDGPAETARRFRPAALQASDPNVDLAVDAYDTLEAGAGEVLP